MIKLVIGIFLVYVSSLYASTHWKVQNGKIQPQVRGTLKLESCGLTLPRRTRLNKIFVSIFQLTSPFYLKKPNDLVAFLNQSDFKKKIDEIVSEFSAIKLQVLNKMSQLDIITSDLTTKTSCILNYYLDETEFFTTTLTRSYMNRLGFREGNTNEKTLGKMSSSPKCSKAMKMEFSMYFDQLDSVYNRKTAKMEPEEIIWQGFSLSPSSFAILLANNLKQHPDSWKWHTLGESS